MTTETCSPKWSLYTGLTIWFSFQIKDFYKQDFKFAVTFGDQGRGWVLGPVNLDMPYFSLLLLEAFALLNLQNIDGRIHLKLELQEIEC